MCRLFRVLKHWLQAPSGVAPNQETLRVLQATDLAESYTASLLSRNDVQISDLMLDMFGLQSCGARAAAGSAMH